MMTRATRPLAIAAALFLISPALAEADEQPAVVELYTSQGCSSCPPADAVLASISGRTDVIALSLHVDYWDYIGWKDTFGNPRFTERQKAYARVAGENMIYTPQMVVNGVRTFVGTDKGELEQAIGQGDDAADVADLKLVRAGGRLQVHLTPVGKLAGGALVELVRYMPEERVEVREGENQGKTITYRNIVTDWDIVGKWDGSSPVDLDLPLKGAHPVVVLVQEPGPGRIVAAAVDR